ncbi:MAG: hypothetical protein QW535_03325 [Candidatus Nezhaarchaeales archaeon]
MRVALNKTLGPILLLVGVGLILFVVYVAYNEYLSASNILISKTLQTSLVEILSLFSIIAVKAIFLSFIVWGGSLLLSNGIKLLHEEKEEKGEKR